MNPTIDQQRRAFLASRAEIRKVLLPSWPRAHKELKCVEVDIDWVRFSTMNHRTKAEQMKEMFERDIHDLFSADPMGDVAQAAQYEILKRQAGFSDLKGDIRDRRQQEPAVLTADGILINGNRRAAALRSLYHDDNELLARYITCLVLPDDATLPELVDLEAELQVAQDFKEEYSWVNAAFLIEELYEREAKDFGRVAKKMHRPVRDVQGLYDKLQQLHQLVAMSNGARQHIDFSENESAFDELAKHIKGKQGTPEGDSVKTAYFIGTLTGTNYRALRHLQRPDASQLVFGEINKNPALRPIIDFVDAQETESEDLLDDFLGDKPKTNRLNGLLKFLVSNAKEGEVQLPDGGRVEVQTLYRSIQTAVTAAAAEAQEEEKDHSILTAPLGRLQSAISDLERAASALQRARHMEGWDERKYQETLVRLIRLTATLK